MQRVAKNGSFLNMRKETLQMLSLLLVLISVLAPLTLNRHLNLVSMKKMFSDFGTLLAEGFLYGVQLEFYHYLYILGMM